MLRSSKQHPRALRMGDHLEPFALRRVRPAEAPGGEADLLAGRFEVGDLRGVEHQLLDVVLGADRATSAATKVLSIVAPSTAASALLDPVHVRRVVGLRPIGEPSFVVQYQVFDHMWPAHRSRLP
jgi:hypothetical protein